MALQSKPAGTRLVRSVKGPPDKKSSQTRWLSKDSPERSLRAINRPNEPSRRASVPKADLWTLVGAAQQLRLASASLAELPASPATGTLGQDSREHARALAKWYGEAASHIRGDPPVELNLLEPWDRLTPDGTGPWRQLSCQMYVDQFLRHLHLHHGTLIGRAKRLYRAIREPWRHASAPTTLPPPTASPPALLSSPR